MIVWNNLSKLLTFNKVILKSCLDSVGVYAMFSISYVFSMVILKISQLRGEKQGMKPKKNTPWHQTWLVHRLEFISTKLSFLM
jgi:hypothetical protein